MADRLTLSRREATRIAIAAQGFTDPRPAGRVDRRHLRRVLDRIGVIQIDSVNVLVRSHELPLFARLGPHPRSLIADATDAGELFEYWAHMAAHARTADHHLYRWRMTSVHQWSGVRLLNGRRPGYVDQVLAHIRDNGPVVSGDLQQRVGPKGTWWDWDDGKLALEHLFNAGLITARRRRNDFARVYDLTERLLPADVLARPTPPEGEARKQLLMQAASAMGVATLADLADYHRQKVPECRALLRELVDDGQLIEARVEGWKQPAYLHPAAKRARRIAARALLSPFDSLIWNRDRTERLFGFHYRIEIYVPKPKRVYGYYVLPFLLGDELVARVDLKSDRQRGVLLVQGAYGEPGVPESQIAEELLDELQLMARWLGLDDGVEIVGRGDLAPALSKQLTRRAVLG